MTDPDVTVTSLSRLSTGYWQVRFGRERFVQWPVDRVPTADDVFHGDKHADILALAALAATEGNRDSCQTG